jgi:hypothetical protein
MDRERDCHGTLGKLEARAFIGGNLQPIRHQIELPARHAKRWMIVDIHARILTNPRRLAIEFMTHPSLPLPRQTRLGLASGVYCAF